MTYRVQIVFPSKLIDDENGETAMSSGFLSKNFQGVATATQAGNEEVKRLAAEGTHAFFNVLDEEGRACGPSGAVSG